MPRLKQPPAVDADTERARIQLAQTLVNLIDGLDHKSQDDIHELAVAAAPALKTAITKVRGKASKDR